MSRIPSAMLLLALVGGGAACDLEPVSFTLEGQLIVDDARETEDTVELAAAVAAIPSLPLDASHTTLASVVAAQTKLAKFFLPPSCLAVDVAGNVVTYTLDHCTGPWGAADLTGAEIVTFSPGDGPGSIYFEMQSVGLKANGVDVEHHVDVFVTLEETGKRILWQGGFSGTSAKGKAFSNESDLDLFLGEDGCARLSGTASSKVGLREVELDFLGIERCGPAGTCPNGVIEATGKLSGVTISLLFDGTQTLLARGENGGELEGQLKCTPPEAPAP